MVSERPAQKNEDQQITTDLPDQETLLANQYLPITTYSSLTSSFTAGNAVLSH